MNCRSFAALTFALVVLVHAGRTAEAKDPTIRPATATATILHATTNDPAAIKFNGGVRKFIGVDGHVTKIESPNSRPIIISDLP